MSSVSDSKQTATPIDSDDLRLNPSTEPTLAELVQRRFSRRDLLRGALSAGVLAPLSTSALAELLLADASAASATGERADKPSSRFTFEEIERGVDGTHHVAPGYSADVLIRWGDPVVSGAPDFSATAQTPEAQQAQFGYNNDFIGYVPLPLGSDNPEHGLLCVNHEYTNTDLMFPGVATADDKDAALTRAVVDTEMAAHGGSVIEIIKRDGKWQVVPDSRFARRVSALSTEMTIAGPAAGHPRLQTGADASGRKVIGTINNCAGGITPWGTYLMAEENFHYYFSGSLDGHPEQRNYERVGVPKGRYAWAKFHERFDVNAEPNEANRFGWIVEVDPLDPGSTPVKRTALGRFKHEGAESIVNKDGRLVVYSGDDQVFEFLYKYVSDGKVTPLPGGDATDADIAAARAANRDLLDQGTLYVAKLDADGGVTWLPLVQGQGPLTADNGFESQADVLIEARRAATELGATPLDRPEDVEPNPVTNKVYVMLTNNKKRGTEGEAGVDAVNPRAENLWGQVLEITPADDDHAATAGTWDLVVRAGNPSDPGVQAAWNPATSDQGWFACPDNCAVDPTGRLWVSTDQGGGWSKASGGADGVWALETEGEARGTGRMFFRVPVGAEMCGPRFTPDGRTLFVAVQHPASDGADVYPGFERESTFEDPATRWPDFQDGVPPRPSVVVITKDDGGEIGS